MKTAKAVRYDELEGKTVAGAGYGFFSMLIAFTDGTVLALKTGMGGDGEWEIDFEQRRDIDLLCHPWRSQAYEAGLISNKENLAARDQEKQKRIDRLEKELGELKK